MATVIRILKWLGVGLGALLCAGAVYQQAGLDWDARYAPPKSDFVRVEGRAVHLACSGSGKRSYLLDAGAGAGVFEWYLLMPLLSHSGRVCAFDRPGLGWSEPGSRGADALGAAENLHALARAAHIRVPFIYVGHSLGANFGQVYQGRYPKDLAALVLLEPGMPRDMLEGLHGTRAEAFAARDCDLACYAIGLGTLLGGVRLASHTLGRKTFDEEHRSAYMAYLARPSNAMTAMASLSAAPKTAYEDMDVASFGNTPVLTFASSLPRSPESGETVGDVRKWRLWQLAQLGLLARKSRHGEGPVIVPNSSHASMTLGAPQAAFVAETILAFLTRAKL